jgi:hypothetical protein
MESKQTGTLLLEKNQNGATGAPLGRSRRSVLAAAGGIALAALVAAGPASAMQLATSNSTTPTVKLTTVAEFPVGTFLENEAVRADGSLLVTAFNKKQLWYVPAPTTGTLVQPMLLHTFAQLTIDIVETTRDVFYLGTSNAYTTHESYLQRVDLRHWQPGMPVPIQPVLKFPFPVYALNGMSVLAPNVILVADSGAGLIWRVDLSADGMKATTRVWLKDHSMDPNPNLHLATPQPGINGIQYATRTSYLYYTSTAQRLFMRVPVDPRTLNPAGAPEIVATGSQWDDFDIDQNAGVAYATTHRQNTIERIQLDPHSGQAKQTVAGIPLDEQLLGPSRFAWGRGAKDYGRVAYVTTDGGLTAPPPDGVVRPARVLRVDLVQQ